MQGSPKGPDRLFLRAEAGTALGRARLCRAVTQEIGRLARTLALPSWDALRWATHTRRTNHQSTVSQGKPRNTQMLKQGGGSGTEKPSLLRSPQKAQKSQKHFCYNCLWLMCFLWPQIRDRETVVASPAG